MVETGPGGRLLIRLADGSLVRLGENARLVIASLQEDAAAGGLVKGLFDVLRGSIRFTSSTVAPVARREIDLQLAATTVAIRGTDVWGRNDDGAVTVCLIEGQVNLHHPVSGERTLDQSMSFFRAPREGEPHPVAPVDPNELKQWTAATELVGGQGVLLPGGGWSVQLSSHTDEAGARQAEQELLKRGLPAELTTAQVKDRTYYRLRLSGFDTQRDAKSFAATYPGVGSGPKPWVTCNVPAGGCR